MNFKFIYFTDHLSLWEIHNTSKQLTANWIHYNIVRIFLAETENPFDILCRLLTGYSCMWSIQAAATISKGFTARMQYKYGQIKKWHVSKLSNCRWNPICNVKWIVYLFSSIVHSDSAIIHLFFSYSKFDTKCLNWFICVAQEKVMGKQIARWKTHLPK